MQRRLNRVHSAGLTNTCRKCQYRIKNWQDTIFALPVELTSVIWATAGEWPKNLDYVFLCETSCESKPIFLFRPKVRAGWLPAGPSMDVRRAAKVKSALLCPDPYGRN